jgi:hypothetical protein
MCVYIHVMLITLCLSCADLISHKEIIAIKVVPEVFTPSDFMINYFRTLICSSFCVL